LDPIAAAHAAAALATLGEGSGVKHLRALLGGAAHDEARRVAFEALCLLGSPADQALLAGYAGATPARLAWLAWHGHPDHVLLIAAALKRVLMTAETYEDAEILARALERIGGGDAPRPTGFGPSDVEGRMDAWLRAFEERRPAGASRLRRGVAWAPM